MQLNWQNSGIEPLTQRAITFIIYELCLMEIISMHYKYWNGSREEDFLLRYNTFSINMHAWPC